MATPTDILLSNTKLDENAANGTVVGTLSAVDTDPTSYTWQLVDDASGAFSISGNSLKVAASSLLDYEKQTSLTIQVQVTEGTSTYSRLFTIYLNDLGETITGTSGNDTLTATIGGDTYSGGNGADSIDGGGGNDKLDGGAGADSMAGGIGNDTFVVDDAADVATDEAFFGGTDTVQSSITYTLSQYVENLTLTGTANLNAYGSVAAGGKAAFTSNVLKGNSGNNILDGGAGADTMYGGAGNDTFYVDNTSDMVVEYNDQGSDLIVSSVTYSIDGGTKDLPRVANNLTLTGTANINGTGGAGANVITGNTGNNILDGKTGIDTLTGDLGNDTYYVDTASDKVIETTGGTASFQGGTDVVMSSVSYSLLNVANVEKLTLIGTGNTSATGNTLDNVLTGNAGNNKLTGGGGNDTLMGDLGDDTYVLETTTDVVSEVTPDNASTTGTIEGGIDTIQIAADYSLKVIANVERLELGGTGNFKATGNTLDNALVGNSGNNVLDGDAGKDTMTGGAGNDTFVVDNAGDIVTEGASGGTDVVQSTASFTLGAEVEDLVLVGSAAVNGTGNGSANHLTGNGSANALDGGAGIDTMTGGAGDDTYYIDSNSDVIVEIAGQGTDTVAASFNYTLGAGVIENLTITGLATTAVGNGFSNYLTGNTKNNSLDGGIGTDTMAGGIGDDTYAVDNAGDVVVEANSEGTDTVVSSVTYSLTANAGQPTRYVENLKLTGTGNLNATGNGLNNSITGNTGANSINGGAGNDTMSGGAGNDTYTVDSASDVVTELANEGTDTIVTVGSFDFSIASMLNVENVKLTGTGISLTGNSNFNVLTGNTANNVINGGGGIDTMIGGVGDDTYIVDLSADIIQEQSGAGTDVVQSSANYTLGANVETLTLTGSAAINATGNTVANTLNGNSGANVLDGKAGADTMAGGDGNDTYFVDNALDVVREFAGDGIDTVNSTVSFTLGNDVNNLILTGTQGLSGTGNTLDNALTGNVYANLLDGSTGNDTLAGGGGNDTLIGGVGADVYLFNVAANSSINCDKITGFEVGVDKIYLSKSVFTGLASLGALAPTGFVIGGSATNANHRIIYNSTSGDLLYDADGSGQIAAVKFATIGTGLTTLSASDFFVV